MLRIYFMQQWYVLSDPGLEDVLYEIESMRRFAGLNLVDNTVRDETMILVISRKKLPFCLVEFTRILRRFFVSNSLPAAEN